MKIIEINKTDIRITKDFCEIFFCDKLYCIYYSFQDFEIIAMPDFECYLGNFNSYNTIVKIYKDF